MPSMKGLAPGQTAGRVPTLNKGGGKDKEGNPNRPNAGGIGAKGGSKRPGSGWTKEQGNQMSPNKAADQRLTDPEEKGEGADDNESDEGAPPTASEGSFGGKKSAGAKAFATSPGKRFQTPGTGRGGTPPNTNADGDEQAYDSLISNNAKAFATDIKKRSSKIQAANAARRGRMD